MYSVIITGLFQATRPIANTNNTKLHTQKNTHKHANIYTVSKRKKTHKIKGSLLLVASPKNWYRIENLRIAV